jgi:hypothetical protein
MVLPLTVAFLLGFGATALAATDSMTSKGTAARLAPIALSVKARRVKQLSVLSRKHSAGRRTAFRMIRLSLCLRGGR